MSFNRLFAPATLALLAGCASDSRTTAPSPSEVPFQNGVLSGTTMGRIGAAQTTSGPGATLTGLVGTFTSLSAGGPALGNVATVYFTERASPAGIAQRIRTDGSGLQRLFPDSVQGFSASVSPSGDRLFFWQTGGEVGNVGAHLENFLTELLPDGTIQRVATDTDASTPVSWSQDERSVFYPVQFRESPFPEVIRRLTLDSSGPQDLVERRPGRNIPTMTVGPVNGHMAAIYTTPERGLNLVDLTTGIDSAYFTPVDSDFVSGVDLTRDGQHILIVYTRRIGPDTFLTHVRVGDPSQPEAAESLFTFPGSTRFSPIHVARWVPDGSGFVVSSPGTPGNTPQLYLLDNRGKVVRQLTQFPQGIVYESGGFSVGPAAAGSRQLIGEDGLLGTTASGIIFGQSKTGGLTSVLGFQSDRPRSVTLKANTGLNSTGPALTYTLTADQLRTLRFINRPTEGRLVTVVDSTSGPAGGALINFDADSGTVTLVLPFAAGESSAVTVTESGSTRIFRGNFLGAWKGRTNLAPGGATEVQLETATNRVEVTP